MKAFSIILVSLGFIATANAQSVVEGTATVEASAYSDYATLQVHGPAAQALYSILKFSPVAGVKRGPGITCVQQARVTYCSMSVGPKGEVEGDGISGIQPLPGVSMGSR